MKIAILSALTIPSGTTFKMLLPYEPLAHKQVHPHPWVANLAFGLAQLENNEVHVISLTSNVRNDVEFTYQNVHYHLLKSTEKTFRKLTLNYFDNLKVQKKLNRLKPDIVHGQGRQTDGLSAVKSRFPNIITSHGEIVNELKSYKKNYKYIVKRYFEEKVNKNMKFAIGVSPTTVADLQRFLKKENTFLIDNALAPEFFDSYQLKWESKVLYVGALSARKRVLELIQAIEKIDHLSLSIATQTPENNLYFKEIRAYIENVGIKNRIHFLGQLAPKEVANEMAKSLCVVLPSNFESFGMPMAEAQAIGKPVIGSMVGGIPYLVEEGKTGFLIEPGNTQQITEKLMYFLNHIDEAKKMGTFAAEKAQKRWHPISVAKTTFEVYQMVIKNS
ncbi:MAG: glycosyltransferase [Bacteroidales bacterium]|nr:glycosyltransferase [Bacteroidales bacterium]